MRTPSPLLAAVLLLAAASARTAPPVSVHAEPDGSVAVRFASAGETPAIRFSGLRLSYPGAKAVYRFDGYVLSDLSAKPYRAPEPWIDPWATKTPVVLPANADTVTVVDSIGRETAVPAQSGAVTVVLDGAVRLVRGLDAARLPLASGK